LYNCGKQIILTSIIPPEDIPKMGEGLKSRLGCGLVVRLQAPRQETRRRILEAKALAEGVHIPDAVLEYLASHINGNIRQMEGTVIGIIAQSSLMHRPIDLDLARESLRNVVKEEERIITVERIQEVVGRYYRIDIERMKSKSKRKDIYLPRQVAMYLCRKGEGRPSNSPPDRISHREDQRWIKKGRGVIYDIPWCNWSRCPLFFFLLWSKVSKMGGCCHLWELRRRVSIRRKGFQGGRDAKFFPRMWTTVEGIWKDIPLSGKKREL